MENSVANTTATTHMKQKLPDTQGDINTHVTESDIPRSCDSRGDLEGKDIKHLKSTIQKVGLCVYLQRTLHHDDRKYPFLSTHLYV